MELTMARPNRRKELQISYPVAMTRKVTLHHNITQIHYQRFFDTASARMASVQGLRVNEDTDDEIMRIEELFKVSLEKAAQQLSAITKQWKERLEAAGVEPDSNSLSQGIEFDAPITTPWSNRLLKLYGQCDEALMLIEMNWIIEELGSVVDKRNAVVEARAPLVETVRQIQRAVTQAFQETKTKEAHHNPKPTPQAWGESGTYLAEHAPDVFEVLSGATAQEPALFDKLIQGIKAQQTDPRVREAVDAVAQTIREADENESPAVDSESDAEQSGDIDDDTGKDVAAASA
ncbi:hypothetical protein [Acidihalobacter ferrooxydans]|uniref:hypothetical protein n=1 Tax=Acidihalobacter ferrooxydans TaxID=1765967 RepID=UPI0018DD242A|nr:hypothetical protein [Acidihalobacter ferrooxydans]